MQNVWIHIDNPSYWESPATVVSLPLMPRIGETVYLTWETMIRLIDAGAFLPKPDIEKDMRFKDNFEVLDICHIEDEEIPHILISTRQ